MSHQLVGQRPGDAFEKEGEHGVFENAAVFDLQEIRQVLLVVGAALNGLVTSDDPYVFAEAEIAKPTREFDELLGSVVGVAAPIDIGVAEKLLTGQQRNLRLADNLHVIDS